MIGHQIIDVSFDVRSDSRGPDPDNSSATLKRYHQALWSKPLPNGKSFDLSIDSGKGYLYHQSALGEFILTSDSVLATFTGRKRYQHIISQVPQKEVRHFQYVAYTVGGMMIFPGNKVDGRMTINGARGFNRKISDRFDLTLECIRRHYDGNDSPLASDLARYPEFFGLFGNFKAYVDFFLLQDLVSSDYSRVRFFTTFDDFASPPLPENLESYLLYKHRSIEFVTSRNGRIANLT